MVVIAQRRGDEEMISGAEAHGITEADRLKQIEYWLPSAQRSSLMGPCRFAGWLAGALPQRLIATAVMARMPRQRL
jgi:3-demethoxyubiquinol 3-hydroxylase